MGWGWGVLSCVVDHIVQEFNTLFRTRFKIYKIDIPPQTKMASKDDNEGLVSLKFLRPCLLLYHGRSVLFREEWGDTLTTQILLEYCTKELEAMGGREPGKI